MAIINDLTSIQAWIDLWSGQARDDASARLVFKASHRCPISRAAESEFEAFAASLPEKQDRLLYRVNVVNNRQISQQIAEDTGIRHESPQAILIGPQQTVLWHASHHAITEQSLSAALDSSI